MPTSSTPVLTMTRQTVRRLVTKSRLRVARPNGSYRRVRKSLATVSLLFAWLCANGAVSDVAQIFAWSRMFTQYAQVLPVSAALTETFDASKPCELCLAVKATRATQESRPEAILASAEKLLLSCTTPTPLVFPAPAVTWPEPAGWCALTRVEAVPVPPPRA